MRQRPGPPAGVSMTDVTGIDWEDAFTNAAYIPDGMSYPATWAALASEFRAGAQGTFDIAYGNHPRERFDLFRPQGDPKGLAVIIHGGFWLAFDKSSWSHLAAGAVARGWAVAMPSYVLAPEATIPEITAQIGKAITAAAALVDGPIHLGGHSAGGHLVTRMICETTPLKAPVSKRIARVVSISGLHDLRPLQLHSMNEKLKLTGASAEAESAALLPPLPGPEVIAWVGGAERPEFLRQSALLSEAWSRAGTSAHLVADPRRHHFDVIEGLIDPGHPLARALTGD